MSCEVNKIRMPQAVKERWISALRSGKYKQGKGSLLDDTGGYCCLGVLVKELEGKLDKLSDLAGNVRYERMPSMEFLAKHGIEPSRHTTFLDVGDKEYADSDCFEVVAENVTATLPELNDDWNYNFVKISNIIEEQVEGYTNE